MVKCLEKVKFCVEAQGFIMFCALITVKGMVIKMKNRTVWKDLDGKDIQAHGGCII